MDGAEPLFSIIVPTFNRPDLLARAVRSTLDQAVTNIEVIVVDDASDHVPLLPSDRRLRAIRHDVNMGVAACRNTGLRSASGRYVAFLDDDDWWLPQRLNHALEGLARAPVSICGNASPDGRLLPTRVLEGDVFETVLNDVTPHLGQTAIRRDRVPFFDESFSASQDIEWWLRVAAELEVATVMKPGFVYYRHKDARVGNGVQRRIECGYLLMQIHADYFATHTAARAFRWLRLGLMHLQLNEVRAGRVCLYKSIRTRPSSRAVYHLVRTLTPGTKFGR